MSFAACADSIGQRAGTDHQLFFLVDLSDCNGTGFNWGQVGVHTQHTVAYYDTVCSTVFPTVFSYRRCVKGAVTVKIFIARSFDPLRRGFDFGR